MGEQLLTGEDEAPGEAQACLVLQETLAFPGTPRPPDEFREEIGGETAQP